MANKKTIRRFDKRTELLPAEIWAKISQIDDLKAHAGENIRLSPQALARIRRPVLIASAGASLRMDGGEIPDEAVENFMRGMSVSGFSEQHKEEMRAYYRLLKRVFDSANAIPFDEHTIRSFYRILEGAPAADASDREVWRKGKEIRGAAGIPGRAVPEAMRTLTAWTREALARKMRHPLIITANFVIEFLTIQPFEKGNGASARILTDLLLIKTGYRSASLVSHEKLLEDHRADYMLALRNSQRTFQTTRESIIPWLDFFLTLILRQSYLAMRIASRENTDKLLSPKQLRVWQYIQERDEVTTGSIEKATHIARPTVKQILEKLLRLGKVERIGLGRSTRYWKT